MARSVRRFSACAVVAVVTSWILGASSARAVDFAEIEPNDTKSTAQAVTLAPGDAIIGISTGALTSGDPLSTADNFDITTTPAPAPGIYRYRLVFSAGGSAGHTVTIRGRPQTLGVISPGDVTMQTGSTLTTPTRYVEWFANEAPSRIIYRVTGTTATTGTYRAELQRWGPVPTVQVPGTFASGPPVVLSNVGQTALDTDIWLYNSQFIAIPDAGNDDESILGGGTGDELQSRLSRVLAPGEYIIAVGQYNLANHLPSPIDDDWRSGPVMDFPNVLLSSGTSGITNCGIVISDGTTTVPVGLTRTPFFGIAFARFTVAGPLEAPIVSHPAAHPNPAAPGEQVTISAVITPGTSPLITSVVADLSAFGLSPQTPLSDLESDGVWSAQFTVPASQPTGPALVSIHATDALMQSASAALVCVIEIPPPGNDTCDGAWPADVGANPGDNTSATSTGESLPPACAPLWGAGVWFSFNAGAGGVFQFDTQGSEIPDPVLAVFDSCGGAVLACDDDSGAGANSRLLIQLAAGQEVRVLVASYGAQPVTGPLVLNITPSAGACCTGTSCWLSLAAACTSSGGEFLGPDSICSATTCWPPAPANDECDGAIALTLGANPGTTLHATTSFTIAPASVCGPFPGSGGVLDVWHTFTPQVSARHTFTTCDEVGFDTVLALYADCPANGGAFPIDCNDDDASCEVSGLRSTLADIPLQAGVEYRVRVAAYAGSPAQSGPYVLHVSVKMPPVFGACCTGGEIGQGSACWIGTKADCAAAAGTFRGSGTVCGTPGNPTTCCPANINGLDGVTVQDIYDFLALWAALSPEADFNGVSGVTVQDIYDFLAAWSAGCTG